MLYEVTRNNLQLWEVRVTGFDDSWFRANEKQAGSYLSYREQSLGHWWMFMVRNKTVTWVKDCGVFEDRKHHKFEIRGAFRKSVKSVHVNSVENNDGIAPNSTLWLILILRDNTDYLLNTRNIQSTQCHILKNSITPCFVKTYQLQKK